jgi:MerR HTH family regulatory protein
MTAARFSYQRLVELVDNDHELIEHLVEEGVIELGSDDGTADHIADRARVDLDSVLAAQTLRELEVDWSGIAIILRLRDELAHARQRIAELEAALAARDA